MKACTALAAMLLAGGCAHPAGEGGGPIYS